MIPTRIATGLSAQLASNSIKLKPVFDKNSAPFAKNNRPNPVTTPFNPMTSDSVGRSSGVLFLIKGIMSRQGTPGGMTND